MAFYAGGQAVRFPKYSSEVVGTECFCFRYKSENKHMLKWLSALLAMPLSRRCLVLESALAPYWSAGVGKN